MRKKRGRAQDKKDAIQEMIFLDLFQKYRKKYHRINASTAINTSSTINKRKRVELIEVPRDPKKRLNFLLQVSISLFITTSV